MLRPDPYFSHIMWYVYIIRCKDGTLYTGATTDINRRIREHNKRKGARYTRPRSPVKLMFSQRIANRSKALKREIEIKSFTRKRKLKLIKGEGKDV